MDENQKQETNEASPPPTVEELLKKENDALKNEFLYLKADTENFKKRLYKEQENAIRYANEKIIRDFLLPIDLLEKALQNGEAIKTSPESKNFFQGIEMIHREITQLLSKYGIEFFGKEGEEFDPSKHEAISQIESKDLKKEVINKVFQKGASYQGRLLTPAKVIVAKPSLKS